jgi:hypothetical protein
MYTHCTRRSHHPGPHALIAADTPSDVTFMGNISTSPAHDHARFDALCFEVLTRNRERLICKFVVLS